MGGLITLTDGQAPIGDLVGFTDDFVDSKPHGTAFEPPWTLGTTGTATLDETQANGVVVMTSAAGTQVNLIRRGAPFRLNYGKKLICGARINLQDFDALGFFVGLVTAGEDTIVNSLPANAAGLINTDLSGVVSALARASSSSTLLALTPNPFTADDQWRELKMIWDGTGSLKYFVNGTFASNLKATLPTGTPLTFAVETAGAAADVMWLDWAYCWQER
jgi:hypothetical protein